MAKKVHNDPELDVASGGFVEEFCTKPVFDADGVQVSSGIKADGKEYPDPVPMSAPVGCDAPQDLMTMIKTMVHSELMARDLDDAGFDTFEEAGDFDVDDDPLPPLSPHEAILQSGLAAASPPVPPAPPAAPAPPKAADVAEPGVASPPAGAPTPLPPAPDPVRST